MHLFLNKKYRGAFGTFAPLLLEVTEVMRRRYWQVGTPGMHSGIGMCAVAD
jgi:hypothetical protein